METTEIDRRAGRRPRSALLVSLAVAALLASTIPAAVSAADALSITTPYPDVAVSPGSKVSFDLTVKSSVQREVKLSVGRVPSGWTATLHGGGYVVDGVTADPAASPPPSVRLDVDVPADASAGTTPITVTASSGGLTATLDLSVRVNTEASGQVTMTTDFPVLKGPASSAFNFSLTLSNDTAQDLTFSFTAQGPDGWDVSAKPASQSQAASTTVTAGGTATINVTASPSSDAAAGDYPITVTATAGSRSVIAQLGVSVTGSYKMSLTTPDQRLNASGQAGSAINRTLEIDNQGSAPLQNVKLVATAPSGWKVTFDPSDTIANVDPNGNAQVTAVITPSGDAIAGDYVVTFHASTVQASASQDIRVTVETSLVWALVGIGLIGLVLIGLGWVFRRYGRR